MISFVAFKRQVLRAFDGEPVNVKVDRRAMQWGVYVKSLDGETGIYATTNAKEMHGEEAIRAFAIDLYKTLIEEHNLAH